MGGITGLIEKLGKEDIKPAPVPSQKEKEEKKNFTWKSRVNRHRSKLKEELQGNFRHTKKTRHFDYQDWSQRRDNCFHVEVATDCESYFQTQRLRVQEAKTEHFAFIVDLDGYEYHKVVFHNFLNELITSFFFRSSILLLVVVNAILIGLQTNPEMEKKFTKYFNVLDILIFSVFLFEISIKWVYDFRLFWKVGWNILDFIIVFLIITQAVVPAFGRSRALVVGVKVVRSFRSLRSVSFLTTLSVVAKTIFKSIEDLRKIFTVLIIFMFMMAVMGVIFFDSDVFNVKKRFLSAADAWYVIFICVTQDGWNTILREFREPREYFFLMAFYLIFAVSIGAFVFSNLIVAVIVANLERSVTEMREEKRHTLNPLTYNVRISEPFVDIYPIYDLLSKNPVNVLCQRPLRIPNLGKISARRLQAYISTIVALEQNMMEAEIINKDFERIISVILSMSFQLDIYSKQRAVRDDIKKTYKQAVDKSKKIDGTSTTLPESLRSSASSVRIVPVTSLLNVRKSNAKEDLAYMQILKNRESVDFSSLRRSFGSKSMRTRENWKKSKEN